ncbi:MAG: hypothetical protein JWN83_1167 [Chitinophagaceae bacterium]|nr:hypothetical protein [Chitinophagaceae bacterium]
MKQLIKFTAFFLIASFIFTSCKKEIPVPIYGTMPVSVPASRHCLGAGEYDLDIIASGTFNFLDNYNDPWDGDPPGFYYDETYMRAKGIIQPLGNFEIGVYEYADSAVLSDSLYSTGMQIMNDVPNPSLFVGGDLSGINFKKLIREGGGSFTGTITVTYGTAKYCDANVFKNLPPLIVTGNLNVGTQTISLRITGKTFF